MNQQFFINSIFLQASHLQYFQQMVEAADKRTLQLLGTGIHTGLNVEINNSEISINPGIVFDQDGNALPLKKTILKDTGTINRPTSGLLKWITLSIKASRFNRGEVVDFENNKFEYYIDESCVLETIEGIEGDSIENISPPVVDVNNIILADILVDSTSSFETLQVDLSRRLVMPDLGEVINRLDQMNITLKNPTGDITLPDHTERCAIHLTQQKSELNADIGNIKAMAHGNGVYISIDDNPAGGVLYSTDGLSYQRINGTSQGEAEMVVNDIIFNDISKIFIAVGDYKIWTSSDGVEWIERAQTSCIFNSLAMKNNNIIVVGGELSGVPPNFTHTGRIYQSIDGYNWNDITPSVLELPPLYSIATGVECFITVDNAGNCFRSEDGTDWVETGGFSILAGSGKVFHLNNMFFVMGTGGMIFHTTDGTVWNSFENPGTPTVNINFVDGIYILSGEKKLYISKNLNEWEEISLLNDYIYLKAVNNQLFLFKNDASNAQKQVINITPEFDIIPNERNNTIHYILNKGVTTFVKLNGEYKLLSAGATGFIWNPEEAEYLKL